MASANYRHTVGMESLSDVLQRLPLDVRTKSLESGMKAAIRPIAARAKQLAPVLTGALRDAIATKTKNYPNTGKCVGLVGPARNKRRGAANPAKYAHLVERGHLVRISKPGRTYRYTKKQKTALAREGNAAFTGDRRTAVTFVAPRPFLRPAAMGTVPQQSRGFYDGIKRGIAGVIKKGVKAGTHVR